MLYKDTAGNVATALSWNAVTTRVDGTPFGKNDFGGYELGTSNPEVPDDPVTPWVSIPAAWDSTTFPLSELPLTDEGTWEVSLRVTDKSGQSSGWSAPVVFIVSLAQPSAPTGLSVS